MKAAAETQVAVGTSLPPPAETETPSIKTATPPKGTVDDGLKYFNERQFCLTSRQAVTYYLDAILELRVQGWSYARISYWVEKQCTVTVSPGFLHRVLTPVSETDPRPQILIDQEIRKLQLAAGRKYAAELAALKPGRPSSASQTFAAGSVVDPAPVDRVALARARSTSAEAQAPSSSILDFRPDDPRAIAMVEARIAKSKARKAALASETTPE